MGQSPSQGGGQTASGTDFFSSSGGIAIIIVISAVALTALVMGVLAFVYRNKKPEATKDTGPPSKQDNQDQEIVESSDSDDNYGLGMGAAAAL